MKTPSGRRTRILAAITATAGLVLVAACTSSDNGGSGSATRSWWAWLPIRRGNMDELRAERIRRRIAEIDELLGIRVGCPLGEPTAAADTASAATRRPPAA